MTPLKSSTSGEGLRRMTISLGTERWDVDVMLDANGSEESWLEIGAPSRVRTKGRHLLVQLSMRHPFSRTFVDEQGAINEGVVRLAIGLAISEAIAQDDGVRSAGRIRSSLNELLLLGLADR